MNSEVFFKNEKWYYNYRDSNNFRHTRICRNCKTKEEAERYVSLLKFLNDKSDVAGEKRIVENLQSDIPGLQISEQCSGNSVSICCFILNSDKGVLKPDEIKKRLIEYLSSDSIDGGFVITDELQAEVELETEKKIESEKLPDDDIESILTNYYVRGSDWIHYDMIHGSVYSDKVLKQNHTSCLRLAKLLSDVGSFSLLTKSRLHKLQDQLLSCGITGKSVNNNMSVLHKVILQLIDKEIIKSDPFTGLRKCSHTKQRRTCFPVSLFNGFFSGVDKADVFELLAYCAIVTGARRGELLNLQETDIELYDDGKLLGREIYSLKINGTKSAYSVRTVPLSETSAMAVKRLLQMRANTSYNMERCTEAIGKKLEYSLEKIKQEGIVFHSFRKMYKTILTGANLNTTAVEMFMGHSTNNQSSNDVERIYFVQEKADLRKLYFEAVEAFDFLVCNS